jgi:hypothetical protein
MTRRQKTDAWELVPSTLQDIEMARKKCRRLVVRRAAMSAGVSALPIPGLDIATDLAFLARAIEDISIEFGLSPDQIARLQPRVKLIAYEMMVGMGGVMIGKVVTREVVAHLLQRGGLKMMTKYAAKIVPIAGQIVSASIGFVTFRAIANQHIEACAAVAAEIMLREAG